ncbi:hypothetical protein SS50377_23633 [Spironucleus salmonicida]|nr:hypothetical protein SS50377_23633 [Spironucleus salmonicida]
MLELRDSNKATVLKYEEKLSSAYQQIDNQNQTIRHMTQEIEKVSKRYNNILNGTNDDKASVTYLQQLIKDTNQQLQQNFKEIYQLKIQLQNYSIMEQEHQKLSNEHKYMQGQIQNLKHDLLVSQNNYQRMVQINDKFKDSLDLQSSQIITQLNQIDLYSEQIETYEKEVESLSNSQTTHFKIDITKVASKDFEYITSPKQPIVGNITDAEKLFLQEYSDIFIYKFDRMVFYNQNKKVLLDEYYSIRDQILNVNILKQCGIPINIAVRAANEEKYCLNAALQYLSANNTIYTLVHTQLEQNVFGQVVKMILAQYKVGISRNQFWVKLDTNIQFI